jgi:adenine-specific DNA glycosylase
MTTSRPRNLFSTRILDWFDLHGRKNLPWQTFSDDQNQNTYRVWLSAPVSIAAAAHEVDHA